MSKVFSFRLSGDNPREIKAREIIETRISQGYSLRQILTEALIADGNNQEKPNGLDKYIDRLSELIQGLESGKGSSMRSKNESGLHPSFVKSVRSSAKRGISSK